MDVPEKRYDGLLLNSRAIKEGYMKASLYPTKKNRITCLPRLFLIYFFMAIQGCVGAAPCLVMSGVGLMAGEGFLIYKTVQLSTGGEVEVRFEESKPSLKNKEALSSLQRLAIYPSAKEAVMLAEHLSKSGKCEIISPFTVKEALRELGGPANLEGMLKSEKRKYMLEICAVVKADGIFLLSSGGEKADAKVWSFSRPEISWGFHIALYASKYKGIIWSEKGDVVLEGSSKIPPKIEIQGILASALAEKFLEDSGKGKGIENLRASQPPVTPQPAVLPSPKKKKGLSVPEPVYLLTIKNSNIRTKPTTKSQIITTLKKGTKIEKIGEAPDWFKVRLPSGEIGHIYKPLALVIP